MIIDYFVSVGLSVRDHREYRKSTAILLLREWKCIERFRLRGLRILVAESIVFLGLGAAVCGQV